MHIHGKQNGKIEPYFLQIQHIWRNQFRFEQTPWSPSYNSCQGKSNPHQNTVIREQPLLCINALPTILQLMS